MFTRLEDESARFVLCQSLIGLNRVHRDGQYKSISLWGPLRDSADWWCNQVNDGKAFESTQKFWTSFLLRGWKSRIDNNVKVATIKNIFGSKAPEIDFMLSGIGLTRFTVPR